MTYRVFPEHLKINDRVKIERTNGELVGVFTIANIVPCNDADGCSHLGGPCLGIQWLRDDQSPRCSYTNRVYYIIANGELGKINKVTEI